MTPGEFIAKWRVVELKERSASQSHFNDLCALVGEPTPTDADPSGEGYCFERGARKDSGGDGWADVWKRGCFAWEYKGRRADLDAAFNQLQQYAFALENPPLLIVSDMARFRIRTNWTNSVSETHEFTLEDLADGAARDKSDLTARRGGAGIDLTVAKRIPANMEVAFMGDTKSGPFDVPGDLAREWLRLPGNPNGRPNADVLKPWVNGMDLTRRPAGKWIVDFSWEMSEADAALYEASFRHVKEHVWPMRQRNRRESYRLNWWRHVEPRQGMWKALDGLSRYIVTPTVAKHRLFDWLEAGICPDHQLIAIARDDDVTFGILHSRFHEVWSLRLGTWLGKGNDPRYTPTSTFETFPFPDGLSPDIPAADYADGPHAIADAVRRLVGLRDRWLNPPEWVEWVEGPVLGYRKRPVARDEEAAKKLTARTLTNLYNARPQWLTDAHATLDAAVAGAYGWDARISEEDAVAELLSHNLTVDRTKASGNKGSKTVNTKG